MTLLLATLLNFSAPAPTGIPLRDGSGPLALSPGGEVARSITLDAPFRGTVLLKLAAASTGEPGRVLLSIDGVAFSINSPCTPAFEYRSVRSPELPLLPVQGFVEMRPGALSLDAPEPGEDAIALAPACNAADSLEVNFGPMEARGRAGDLDLVFDYASPLDFSFAGLSAEKDGLRIGRMDHGLPLILAQTRARAAAGEEHRLSLRLEGGAAELTLDGVPPVRAAVSRKPGEVGVRAARGYATVNRFVARAGGRVLLDADFGRSPRDAALTLSSGRHEIRLRAERGLVLAGEAVLVPEGAADRPSDRDRRLIRRVFFDTLGRSPSESELLAAMAHPLADEIAANLRSLEHWRAWYETQLSYFLLLDEFRPATARLDSIPARLASAQISARDALHEIVISQSFNARNPGPDTFVTVVLEQLLAIHPEGAVLADAKALYDGHPGLLFGKPGKSQADVVSIAFGHDKFAIELMRREYARLFGAEAPSDVLEAAARKFHDDPYRLPAIEEEWLLSPAYSAALDRPRSKTEEMFVEGLYRDLLGRPPGRTERITVRNALQALQDAGPLRTVLARILLDSGRAPLPSRTDDAATEDWVTAQCLRLLGRRPSGDEESALLSAIKSGASLKTIILGLVASDEYSAY